VITMPLRALACIVVLATLMAPSMAGAGCSASDRPPGITANSVVFTPTSDTTLHVNWSAPPNLNIDLIIDDQTANQSNINSGKPGGSVTGGLKGATDYDVTNLTPSHNYRLTLSTRSPQNGCLSHVALVLTAATPSTADSNTCKAYAANAETQRNAMLSKGCAAFATGSRWDPVQSDHLQWCIGERLQHQTADVTESQARDDAINACHFNLMSAAFQKWMRGNGVQNATIADETHSAGFGNRQADNAYPIASLTKAITASCVANLVERGLLSYTDTLDKRLSNFLTVALLPTELPGQPAVPATKLPADSRANAITIQQLIRHVSGIQSDPTQPPWAAGVKNEAAAAQSFVRAALSVKLATDPGTLLPVTSTTTAYFYNNTNYAILGMMIEQALGGPYEAYCKRVLLVPHLPDRARVPISRWDASPQSRVPQAVLAQFANVQIPAGTAGLGTFGGWQMSARDYANFIADNYRNMTGGREQFMQASYAVGYGLGVQVQQMGSGRYIWHFGDWHGPSPITPPQFNSYFGLFENGDLIVVLMDKSWASEPQKGSLATALRSSVGLH
jgi:CubicO group peptidase (beta-lactamase class C family)